ncbi:unnamed protein product, partial [Mesorhabditis belari]|uniref:Tafazzin family protein n=1 Tax=Mesorhabditis belari TaxID=2138241 RepID=A0AAF3FT10_9BILA
MTGSYVDRAKTGTGFQYPWPFPVGSPTVGYKIASYATLTFVRSLSRLLFFAGINKLQVDDREKFVKALEDRSRPLITMTNHRCNVDDPLMWTLLTWPEYFRNIDRQRYTLAAHNICFSKQWHTTMFSLGNCVPCVRGEGVFQKGMDFSIDKLNERGWVHIFPEGKVTETPLRVKWGVGRLVMEPKNAPIVLPIWMKGMETIWPNHPPYYPSFGKTVKVTIGDPWDTTELRETLNDYRPEWSEQQKRKLATDQAQELLFQLGEKCGDLEPGSTARLHKEHQKPIELFR